MTPSIIHLAQKYVLIFAAGIILPYGLFAQTIAADIPSKQVQNAQSQARFLVESFGEFLQIIAQSEDGGEVQSMIRMVTEDGQRSKRLFSKKEALIVSDIDPRVVDEESTVGEGFVEVSTYLSDFDAFYAKADPNGILFTDILVSKIKKSSFSGDLYVRVKFRSKFEGKHKDIRKPYEWTDRMARVRIVQGTQWEYAIDLITFLPPQDTTQYYTVETRDQIRKRYTSQLKRAQRLWEIYEFEEALENYRLSNQIFPSDSIDEKIDFIEEAIEDRKDRGYFGLEGYNRKITDEPGNPNLYYERGLKNLEAKQVKAASDDFLKALQLSNQKYKKAWISLADLWEGDQGINGIEYLEQALLLDPLDETSLFRLIRLQVKAGLWPDTKRSLLKVRNLDQHEEMLLYMGLVNQNLDQHKDATESFQKLIRLNPSSARAHFEMGKSYLNLSEFSASLSSFKEAIRLDEDNYSTASVARIYLRKAESHKEENKPILANEAVEQALTLLPDMPEAKQLQAALSGKAIEVEVQQDEDMRNGDLYFMEGNYKEALKSYRAIQRKKSVNARSLNIKMGKCHFELGEYNRAILIAQQLLTQNANDEEALLLRAAALTKKGDNTQALRLIDRVINLNEEKLEALKLKTEVLVEEEDYMAASLTLSRWEELEVKRGISDNLDRRKLRGKTLLGLAKRVEALAEIEYVLKRENFNAEFLYLKALVLFQEKNYDESISFGEASLEADENYEPALILQIKSYLQKGSPQLALSSIDRLQGVNKELYTLSYYKALANYSLGDFKTAGNWISRALRSRKNDFAAQLLNGKILLAQERYLDAGMALNAAYKIDPDHPEANFELGRYYHEFGARQSEDKRFEDALPYYYRAYELSPELFEEHPELLKRLKG